MLYNCLEILFPSSAFYPGSTSPLSVDDFRTVILLPELAVHLIMQDLGQNRATAIDTLLSSIKYGNNQFPLGLEDERACSLMIQTAYRGIRPEESNCDPQKIRQSGNRDVEKSRRKRVLRVTLQAARSTIEGGMDVPPNDGGRTKRQRCPGE